MTMHPRRPHLFLVVATIGALGCAPAQSAVRPASPSIGEMEAIVKARNDSMRSRFTEADVRFMTGMIGHHAQAIVMAKWASTHGASGSVTILAARIINSQQDEINLMQSWLRDRKLPVPDAKAMPMTMVMNGMEHEMSMPGMLTDAQLQELDSARGADFDRLFLTFMIQHHRGAVTMVKALFVNDGAGQDHTVFKFASDVNTDQTTEIARMERMVFTMRLEAKSPPR